MSEILLSATTLLEGWIDAAPGEPYLVKGILDKIFDILPYSLGETNNFFNYQKPNGYQPLVEFLEAKHKAPVVIFNGGKQALCGAFFSLRKEGKQKIGLQSPYWCLLPPIIKMHGLNFSITDDFDCCLNVSPNNPDGSFVSVQELKNLAESFKEKDIPFIHDAVYFSNVYLVNDFIDNQLPPAIGDIQIFSFSKSLGLSSLRVGYAVCHNTKYYESLKEYIEMTTVGVSVLSQKFIYDLLCRMKSYPSLVQKFEGTCSLDLERNKKLCLQIDPDILEVPSNLPEIPGMFLWAKKGPKADFIKSKINIISGDLFGAPGMIRMNLAFPFDKMEEIVRLINSVKE